MNEKRHKNRIEKIWDSIDEVITGGSRIRLWVLKLGKFLCLHDSKINFSMVEFEYRNEGGYSEHK